MRMIKNCLITKIGIYEDKINPIKLMITNKNCKKTNEIILVSNFKEL